MEMCCGSAFMRKLLLGIWLFGSLRQEGTRTGSEFLLVSCEETAASILDLYDWVVPTVRNRSNFLRLAVMGKLYLMGKLSRLLTGIYEVATLILILLYALVPLPFSLPCQNDYLGGEDIHMVMFRKKKDMHHSAWLSNVTSVHHAWSVHAHTVHSGGQIRWNMWL